MSYQSPARRDHRVIFYNLLLQKSKIEIENDNESTSIKYLEDNCGSKSSDTGSHQTSSGSVDSFWGFGLYIGCGKQVTVYFYLNIFLRI